MTEKPESIWNILHSTQTILEKSFPNTWATKVSNHGENFQRPLNQIFDVWELKETYPSRPPSPFPPKSMLVHFGDLENPLALVNIERGSGVNILAIQSQKCSKTFFEDCLSRMKNISYRFSFFLIAYKLNDVWTSYCTCCLDRICAFKWL